MYTVTYSVLDTKHANKGGGDKKKACPGADTALRFWGKLENFAEQGRVVDKDRYTGGGCDVDKLKFADQGWWTKNKKLCH